jgi:hypothetical protein
MLALCTVALLGSVADEAKAQVRFGAHAHWSSQDIDLGIGARASIPVPVENLTIVPSFDFFFPSSVPGISRSWMEFSANAHYVFPLADKPTLLPYAGGGLNFARYSVKFDGFGGELGDLFGGLSGSANYTGLNLLGGAQFGSFGSLKPFGELRYATSAGGRMILTGGVNF